MLQFVQTIALKVVFLCQGNLVFAYCWQAVKTVLKKYSEEKEITLYNNHHR